MWFICAPLLVYISRCSVRHKAFKETRQVSDSVKALLDKYGLTAPEKKEAIKVTKALSSGEKFKRNTALTFAKLH